MKKSLLLTTISTTNAHNSATFSSKQWLPAELNNQQNTQLVNAKATSKKVFSIDIDLLAQLTSTNQPLVIDLPLPIGKFIPFKLTSTTVMSRELAEKCPY